MSLIIIMMTETAMGLKRFGSKTLQFMQQCMRSWVAYIRDQDFHSINLIGVYLFNLLVSLTSQNDEQPFLRSNTLDYYFVPFLQMKQVHAESLLF